MICLLAENVVLVENILLVGYISSGCAASRLDAGGDISSGCAASRFDAQLDKLSRRRRRRRRHVGGGGGGT